MNITKIKAFDKQVAKEVQRAVDAIYKKHSRKMAQLIAKQLPKGKILISGNGLVFYKDSKYGECTGRAWGYSSTQNEELDFIALLQFGEKHRGAFTIPEQIKSKRKR